MLPTEHITVEGLEHAERQVAGVAERMERPAVGFGSLMRVLEAKEASVFAGWGGKYVDTGALKASLTETAASGAIRRLTPLDAAFGSAIPYSVFQGTTGPGNRRPPSAVMPKLQTEEVAAVGMTLMEFIMHGGRP